MSIHNADIAAIFDEIADLLEIQGENPFRIRAYRNAARQMESMGVPAADMVAKGEDLTELPGIGDDLAAKIREIVETGKCRALEKLHRQLPPTLTELLKIPGLGPKRVKTLYQQLKVNTLEQLERAARDGKNSRAGRFRRQDRDRHPRRPGGARGAGATLQAGRRRPVRRAAGGVPEAVAPREASRDRRQLPALQGDRG